MAKRKFKWARKLGNRLAVWIVPPIYNTYLRFISRTSKEVHTEMPKLWDAVDRGENAIGAVWHQDAILGPFIGRGRDIVTMVSHSDFGNVLSQIMRKCHFIPIRGGSSGGGKEALAEIIEYMNTHPGTICGIAVDGSRGPARKVQIGTLLMAKATGAAIYPVRLWAKWKILAPSWDKTLIPLPFNRLVLMIGEPLKVPPDADRDELDALRLELENRLNEQVDRAERFFKGENRTSKSASEKESCG